MLCIQIGSRPLQPGDGHVLLLSSGLLDLMPLASVAALVHQYETREIQMLLDAAASCMEDSVAVTGRWGSCPGF